MYYVHVQAHTGYLPVINFLVTKEASTIFMASFGARRAGRDKRQYRRKDRRSVLYLYSKVYMEKMILYVSD